MVTLKRAAEEPASDGAGYPDKPSGSWPPQRWQPLAKRVKKVPDKAKMTEELEFFEDGDAFFGFDK